jgi:gliding motility-associated-like protein
MFFNRGLEFDGWKRGSRRLPSPIPIVILLLLLSIAASAQRGKIIKPATTQVMDPNGDTFVSTSTLGFSNDGYNVDEFELKMFGIPIVGSGDSLADNQAGAKCGITDITVDSKGYGVYGVIDDNDNLIFRFRLGTTNNSVEAYTILIDTDGKMGPDDPNSTPENPGFEIDITLIKNQNKGVYIFNIDGIESCPDALLNYSFDTNFQIAVADVVSCGDPDYFFDYFVPFSALNQLFGITKDTELRFAAVTNTSATCAMAGKISDVAGVIDTHYDGCNSCAFLDLSSNQCPTTLNNLCATCIGFQIGITPKPKLNLPVKAGQDFISGRLRDPDGTPLVGADIFINVYNSADVLVDRDTTQVDDAGNWLSNFNYVLSPGDSVTARARALDRCSSAGLGSQASFTIVVVNVPPVISGNTADDSYTENDPPLILQPALTIIDPDDTVFEAATVSISANYQSGQDLLQFSAVPGINGSFNPATGILSLTGTASLAAYHLALRGVTYTNSSDNPSALARTVSFVVDDGLDLSNILIRTLNVIPVNDPPVITGSSAQIQYTTGNLVLDNTLAVTDLDNTLITGGTVSITNNFISAEDQLLFTDQLGITGSYSAATGILTLAGTTTLANYATALQTIAYHNTELIPTQVTRRVSFVVSDGSANSAPFNKFVGITPVNYPPFFVDGSGNPITTIPFTTGEDTQLNTCVNVTDPNGDPASLSSIVVLSGSGTFNLTGGLCFSFTPGPNFNGVVTAEVTVCDPNLACATATLEVTVTAANDPPILSGSAAVVTYPGSAVVIDNTLLATDVDNAMLTGAMISIDGNFLATEDALAFADQLGITGSYNAGSGELTLTGTATLADYSAALRTITYVNAFQTSLLTRRISFEVSDGTATSQSFQKFIEFSGNLNRPPFLVDGSGNPVSILPFATNEDTPLNTCITAFDPDGDPIQITSIVLAGGSGVFTPTGGLCFDFTPPPDFSGTSTGTVTICDPSNACAIGTISVTVSPVNDPPVVTGGSGLLTYLTGNLVIDNSIAVADPDNATLASATVAITANFQTAEDLLNFTDQFGITGSYSAATGILSLSGTATLAEYAQALGTVAYSNSNAVPAALTRRVSFVVNDGLTNSQAHDRFISVQQVNVGPRLTDGTNPVDTLYFTIAEDQVLSTCIQASDANGDQVEITGLDLLSGGGSFTLDGGLCFTYNPDLNASGLIKAKITACDGATNSLCVIGGVVILITPVDDPPEITTTDFVVDQDVASTLCVTVTDVEGDASIFSSGFSLDGKSVLTTGASSTDQCFVYTPNVGFTGPDLVSITVCEVGSPSVCTTKTITVDVNKVNHSPEILVNGIPGGTLNTSTPEDTPIVICFESIDPDGDDVTLSTAINTAGGGTLVPYENIEFCFTYTPEKDFNGIASWTITVCDNGTPSLCGTLEILIDVTPLNDAPMAVNDTLSVLRHTVSKANILANDFDVEGDSIILTIQSVTSSRHGQATLSADGFVTYSSDRYYRGLDSLVYEICDTGTPAGCSQATVHFDIGDLPLRIYEGVSPNGDGVNEYWRMDGIDYYAENVVRVFDRYNNLVYEMNNYNNEDRVWRGEANRGVFRGKLPEGVYFYSVKLSNDIPALSGFVILKMEP